MSQNQDNSRNKSEGRYDKLLKGKISPGQYVKSLRQEARSSKTGRYSSPRNPRNPNAPAPESASKRAEVVP